MRTSFQHICWMDAGLCTALCCPASPATTGQPSDPQCWTGWRHVFMRPSNTSMRHLSCSWSPPALRPFSITRLQQQSCRPLRWVDLHLLSLRACHVPHTGVATSLAISRNAWLSSVKCYPDCLSAAAAVVAKHCAACQQAAARGCRPGTSVACRCCGGAWGLPQDRPVGIQFAERDDRHDCPPGT